MKFDIYMERYREAKKPHVTEPKHSLLSALDIIRHMVVSAAAVQYTLQDSYNFSPYQHEKTKKKI